jgi:hypothetical protein
MVTFELALFTAQSSDNSAGQLNALGATGGSRPLASQPFAVGENAFSSASFNPVAMVLFTPWTGLTGTDAVTLARQSIARGETIFNTKTFTMTGVNGLNDVLNQPTIVGTCTTCHNTPNLGNHSDATEFDTGIATLSATSGVNPNLPTYTFTNNATGETVIVDDPGEGLITGKWADLGKFKVPTLRGAAARMPLFHDGTGTTMSDVIQSYDQRFTIGFTTQDRIDLANFLSAL